MYQPLERLARQRLAEVLRPGRVRGDEGQVDVRLVERREVALGALRRLLQALEGEAIRAKVYAGLVAELRDHPADDALVEVLAAEEGVAGRGEHLVNAVADFEYGDVECAAAEVVDGDALVLAAPQPVGERGGGRLVDDALDPEARYLAGVLCGLPLRVVEVGGDGDDGIGDRLAEEVFRRGLQSLQDDSGNLLRAVDAPLHLYARVAVRRLDDLEGRGLARALGLRLFELATDETLDGVDGVGGVGDGLSLGDLADESLALVREADDRGSGTTALFVRHDLNRARFEYGHATVCRPQIYSDYFAHNFFS